MEYFLCRTVYSHQPIYHNRSFLSIHPSLDTSCVAGGRASWRARSQRQDWLCLSENKVYIPQTAIKWGIWWETTDCLGTLISDKATEVEERFYVVFLIGSMSAYAVSQLISKGSDIRHENPVIPSDTPIDIEMACKRATTPMSGPCATKLRRLLDHAVNPSISG